MKSTTLTDVHDATKTVEIIMNTRFEAEFSLTANGITTKFTTGFLHELLEAGSSDGIRNLGYGGVRLFCIQIGDRTFFVNKVETSNSMLRMMVGIAKFELKFQVHAPSEEASMDALVPITLSLVVGGQKFTDMGHEVQIMEPVEGFQWDLTVPVTELKAYAELFLN